MENEETGDQRPRRNKRVATGLAIGLLAGGSAGLIIGTPIFASAQDGSADTEATTSTEAPTTTAELGDIATTTTEAPDASKAETPDDPTSATPETTIPADSKDSKGSDKSSAERMGKRQSWMKDALKTLVDDGTITQAQADSIIAKFNDAAESFKNGRGGHNGQGMKPGRGMGFGESFKGMKEAYEALNMSPAELGQEILSGKTLADIARAKGVDPQVLIDAATAPIKEHLDRSVADGKMTQAEADEHLAKATQSITEMINNGALDKKSVPFLHARPGD